MCECEGLPRLPGTQVPPRPDPPSRGAQQLGPEAQRGLGQSLGAVAASTPQACLRGIAGRFAALGRFWHDQALFARGLPMLVRPCPRHGPVPAWYIAVAVCAVVAACSQANSGASSQTAHSDAIGFSFDIQNDLGGSADIAKDTDTTLAVNDNGSDSTAGDSQGPGSFGAPCVTNADCDSQFCVQDTSGKVCSQTCVTTCPQGWSCTQVQNTPSDTTYICTPTFVHLCDPCTDAKDCNFPGSNGNLCVALGLDGGFCGVACTLGQAGACPNGYDCESVVDSSSGAASNQCVRTGNGACTCSSLAAQNALITPCKSSNKSGSCPGKRSCASGVLSACDAPVASTETCNGKDDDCDGTTDQLPQPIPCSHQNSFGICSAMASSCSEGIAVCPAAVPAAEVCNGVDDNCDGKTDEGLCDDGIVCTTDICNSDGTCKHLPGSGDPCDDGDICTGKDLCVAGICTGTAGTGCDDGNPCTADTCDKISGCQHKNQDGPCGDDGNSCTLDQCASGTCDHPAMPSASPCTDDGNPCTTDTCDGKTCTHPVAAVASPCPDDGDGCTADLCDGKGNCSHAIKPGFCAIGAQCVQAGTAKPGDACQICDPAVNPKAWTSAEGAPCDDGDGCTVSDACGGGVCKGVAKDCTALDSVCSIGKCLNNQCQAQAKPGNPNCDDGNPCTVSDICSGGQCVGAAMNCSALSDSCSDGVCAGGLCVKQAKANSCDDANPCTINDSCAGGGCKGVPMDCSGQSDVCNDGVCVAGGCQAKAKANGSSCSDGDACTVNDQCTGGKCTGSAMSCALSADICNDGVCSGGACQKKPKANGLVCNDGDSCTLSDSCQSGTCKGTAKDCSGSADVCNDGICSNGVCGKKAKSDGTVCNDGSTCTNNDQCLSGVCSGTAIKDAYEPNNSSPGAAIADKTDCEDPASLAASMSPAGDVDWFNFTASDKSFCTIKPAVWLTNLAADYDVCMYYQCNNGTTGSGSLDCAAGTKVSNGPNGSWGCCSTAAGTTSEYARINPSCSFLGTGDDGGKVWIDVTPKSNASMCGGYILQWTAKS